MQFPLLHEDRAEKPVSLVHSRKSKDTLRLEYKLYAAVNLITQGRTMMGFECMIHPYAEPGPLFFPYWSVVMVHDLSDFMPDGFSYQSSINPIPHLKHTAIIAPVGDDMQPYLNSCMEKSKRTSHYSIKTDWILGHMYVDPTKASQGTPRITQAVCIAKRMADTLTIIANRLHKRAMKLAEHIKVTDAVIEEDTRRQQLLAPYEPRPVPWAPTYSRQFGFDFGRTNSVLPRDQKPGNRIAFEERVEMVFAGFITKDNSRSPAGMRISTRFMLPPKSTEETPETWTSGTIFTGDIISCLFRGNTVEAIQKSLEMARGLRASAHKLNEAVCMYFEPMTLALVMSQHKRLGARSCLHSLDDNTLRIIGTFFMEWIDHPIIGD